MATTERRPLMGSWAAQRAVVLRTDDDRDARHASGWCPALRPFALVVTIMAVLLGITVLTLIGAEAQGIQFGAGQLPRRAPA